MPRMRLGQIKHFPCHFREGDKQGKLYKKEDGSAWFSYYEEDVRVSPLNDFQVTITCVCGKEATALAYSRSDKSILWYCEDCGDDVADKQCPEYIVDCPNCNCKFGVA